MFDWDEHNVDHIAEHGVAPDEAEEAVDDPHRVSMPASNMASETRYALLGATEAGRLLHVVATRRGGHVRVVTARPANDREKRRYQRRGK